MTDISVVLTGHREGVLAGATVRSAREAIDHAQNTLDLDIEVVLVIDRGDETTEAVLRHGFPEASRIILADEGDPGQSRNRGVEAATGEFLTFLDADDLWSYNWLVEAWKLVRERPDVIAHSEFNITFGNERNVWWHVDQEGPLFDEKYLKWANYWDAMSFARKEVYEKHPFKANDLKLGFGHEDWHWNTITCAAGLLHKPVGQTIHFKRRRKGSQMAKVAESDSVVWPD